MSKRRPRNCLSLDGGLSGLPALYILEELFGRLQFDLGIDEELKPCDWFDIIIGAGTGAVNAILLGKLCMTVTQAMEAYTHIERVLQRRETTNEKERKRNSEELEAVVRGVLLEAGFSSETPMLGKSSSKTIACTLDIENLTVPYLIRSYRTRGAPALPCTVLQATCASIASPNKFMPLNIGHAHRQVALIDATYGQTNPAQELLREARHALGDDTYIANLTSIGSGKGNFIRITTDLDQQGINEALHRIVASSESVHEALYLRLRETGIYYRFNVERGLDGHYEAHHVSGYLKEGAVSDLLDNACRSIQDRSCTVTLKEINSVQVAEIFLRPRPSLVRHFIGREDTLRSMYRHHFTHRATDLHGPAMTVLTGLGGSGKTQTALKFAMEHDIRYPSTPVYFIDASSEESIKADLEAIIRSFGTAYRAKSHEDALVWLSTSIKHWLLIFDNADNPTLHLFPFIPKSPHGNVVVTTRNSSLAALAPSSTHYLGGLAPSDAVKLLIKSSGYVDNDSNSMLALEIAEALGYLPLALAHAAGYIFAHHCLPAYLTMFRQNQAVFLLDSHPELPQDYLSSVAATIQMSLDRLSQHSRDILRLFSFFHASSIADDIISTSASRKFAYIAAIDEVPMGTQSIELSNILSERFLSMGEWSPSRFNEVLKRCQQYSLLQTNSQGDTTFYSMHILVQTYLKSLIEPIGGHHPARLVSRLLGSAVTLGKEYEFLSFNRLLVPHIRLLRMDDIIEPGDHFAFGDILYETRNNQLSLSHWELCVKQLMSSLGNDHQETLRAKSSYAQALSAMGKNHEALIIEEEIMDRRMKSLGPEDSGTLVAMKNLASSYVAVGREDEALALSERVLRRFRHLCGEENVDTMRAKATVAWVNSVMGKHEEAMVLQEQVLDTQKRILGQDNAETLLTMNNLATSYSALEMEEKAIALEEEALDIQRRSLGLEHPNTLRAIGNLSSTYAQTSRTKEAIELGKEVLGLRTQFLGLSNADTLLAMSNLANIHSSINEHDEALRLGEQALKIYESMFGIEHIDTFRATMNLAMLYSSAGRHLEAVDVGERALRVHCNFMEPENPDIISAKAGLASIYSNAGRVEEALLSDEEVLELYKKVYGEEFSETLLSMDNLADSYISAGRNDDAIHLRKRLVDVQRQSLGENHPRHLVALAKLSGLYTKLGRNYDALEIEEAILHIRRDTNGEEHPFTLLAMRNLFSTLKSLGQTEKAEKVAKDALPIHESVLGLDHPKTMRLRERLIELEQGLRNSGSVPDSSSDYATAESGSDV